MISKNEEIILLALAGLYLYSKLGSNPQPGNPAFVGPIQQPNPVIDWHYYCFDAAGNAYPNPNPGLPCPPAGDVSFSVTL